MHRGSDQILAEAIWADCRSMSEPTARGLEAALARSSAARNPVLSVSLYWRMFTHVLSTSQSGSDSIISRSRIGCVPRSLTFPSSGTLGAINHYSRFCTGENDDFRRLCHVSPCGPEQKVQAIVTTIKDKFRLWLIVTKSRDARVQ